ncbi:peptidoglycan DD-metalloendopeptidase family protein [Microbulbifer sp. SAOS-129_SWC]|uniref:peptidoglycan DD-metalloendopeptidase family protein n=1 Tax=Microbulbifer sp. SAOS-129_SWC TaxID=3145235 RepID=UPI0032167185
MDNQSKPTPQRLLGTLRQYFPRTHAVAAGAASLALALVMFSSTPEVEAKRLPLPVKLSSAEPMVPGAAAHSAAATSAAAAEPQQTLQTKTLKVKQGDTLSDLFERAGVNTAEMYQLLASGGKARQLADLNPGESLTFRTDHSGALQNLELHRDALNLEEFSRGDSGAFKYALHQRQPENYTAYRKAEIKSSLFVAGSDAGLSGNLIMEMADVFSSDIDFALDIRKGDSFGVMYEEKFLDGKKIGNGPIQAVSFTNRGKTFNAVRYVDIHGDANYYTPDGRSMRKAFIRTPVDFTRISSSYNPRRLHPIFKTRRPHYGTDYAAPTGTPVYAAGDGRVVKSGYSKPNGNYIFIQHGQHYMTRYLHLSKRRVKTGDRVKQRQIIGNVGSTGYATGPHLHYEFLVNGQHRNPATIVSKLPKAKSIPSSEMDRFRTQTQPLLAQLENYQRPALAQRDDDSDNSSVN